MPELLFLQQPCQLLHAVRYCSKVKWILTWGAVRLAAVDTRYIGTVQLRCSRLWTNLYYRVNNFVFVLVAALLCSVWLISYTCIYCCHVIHSWSQIKTNHPNTINSLHSFFHKNKSTQYNKFILFIISLPWRKPLQICLAMHEIPLFCDVTSYISSNNINYDLSVDPWFVLGNTL